MKRVMILLLLMSGTLFAYPQVSTELKPILNTLYQVEEIRALIEQVEAKGAISIKGAHLGANAATAAWYPDERVISINLSDRRSNGSLIRSMVFELLNAANADQFDALDAKAVSSRISQQDYVRAVEYLEYQNSLKTSQLLKIGVSKNIFPHDAHLPIAPNFEEHFRFQREAGHSQRIADLYKAMRGQRHLAIK